MYIILCHCATYDLRDTSFAGTTAWSPRTASACTGQRHYQIQAMKTCCICTGWPAKMILAQILLCTELAIVCFLQFHSLRQTMTYVWHSVQFNLCSTGIKLTMPFWLSLARGNCRGVLASLDNHFQFASLSPFPSSRWTYVRLPCRFVLHLPVHLSLSNHQSVGVRGPDSRVDPEMHMHAENDTQPLAENDRYDDDSGRHAVV